MASLGRFPGRQKHLLPPLIAVRCLVNIHTLGALREKALLRQLWAQLGEAAHTCPLGTREAEGWAVGKWPR